MRCNYSRSFALFVVCVLMLLGGLAGCKKKTPTGPTDPDPPLPPYVPWTEWKSDFQPVAPPNGGGYPIRLKDGDGQDVAVTLESLEVSPRPGAGIISSTVPTRCITGMECFQPKARLCYDGPADSKGEASLYLQFYLSQTAGQLQMSAKGSVISGPMIEGKFCGDVDLSVAATGGTFTGFNGLIPQYLDVWARYGVGENAKIGWTSFYLGYHPAN